MAILIDPPAWPAHGTLWSHLISDSDYEELHEFAARLGAPRRGFDLDHYDVPASLYERAIALGALPVNAKAVVHALRGSGLRVRGIDRDRLRPIRRKQYLGSEWERLGARMGLLHARAEQTVGSSEGSRWSALGREVLSRWNESHRKYHDERHLEDVLLALNHLEVRGERLASETLLAAWFHDAVYEGVSGRDEEASAKFAVSMLSVTGVEPAIGETVGEFILATTPALTLTNPPTPLAHLLDADLAIFAAAPGRYAEYAASVRREYSHVAATDFARGRSQILEKYLSLPRIYRTDAAAELWEMRARANLEREIRELAGR